MGSMTEGSVWGARGYWALAAVVLPLIDLPLFWGVALLNDSWGRPLWIPVVILIWVGDGLVLHQIARRIWVQTEPRRRRVALGIVATIALSIGFALAALYVILDNCDCLS